MNTYFALVCLFTILRALSVNEYLLIDYLNFPWWLSTRIELISFYLIFAFTIRFIYYLFPDHIPKFFASIPYYIGVSAAVITLFTPIVYNSNLVPIMQVVTVVIGSAILYYIFKASLKGNKEVIIALIGFILLFAVTIIENPDSSISNCWRNGIRPWHFLLFIQPCNHFSQQAKSNLY